jgi:hypothetical protein
MNVTRVLVANELRSYREAIAEVFRRLRPNVEVSEAEPADLDGETMRLRPDLVVCTRVTPLVELSVRAWVELYPGCEPHSVINLGERRRTLEDAQLSDLLEILDRAEALAQMS